MLDISDEELAEILQLGGIDNLHTLISDGFTDAPEYVHIASIFLIRVTCALYTKNGGDENWMRHFIRNHNNILQEKPIELMKTQTGMEEVLQFLDGLPA